MNKRIITIAGIAIVAIALVSFYVKRHEESFIERTHFVNWEMDYPESDETVKFTSERAFGNDHADYIIFPSDENLVSEIERYIDKQDHLIVSEGDEKDQNYSPPFPVSFFYTFSDISTLEKNIDSYEGYKYWIMEKDGGFEKLGILMSESEVIFLFVAL